MKKTLILLAATVLAFAAAAQPSSLQHKKVVKMQQKTSVGAKPEPVTLQSLLAEMPPLPTVQQYLDHQRIILSQTDGKPESTEVGQYYKTLADIAARVPEVACQSLDSAQCANRRRMELETINGMNPKMLADYEKMSPKQQQALRSSYRNETQAKRNADRLGVITRKLQTPVQPIINQWNAVEAQIDTVMANADKQCFDVYQKYYSQIAAAKGNDRNNLLLNYYAEIMPIRMAAVQKALEMRQSAQLVYAAEIEEMMKRLRSENPLSGHLLPNYIELTVNRCLSQAANLTEIPLFEEK
ncbi:MAG: hypothetical protein K5650_08515 [Bacteroidales bacterium]|nr:hypothetical protein [Bacteroidales bacterium]